MSIQSRALSEIRVMTSAAPAFAGPRSLCAGLLEHRHLILQLTRREVLGRYRGSFLGLLWPFLNPLIMLAIYTVVFRYIFRARFNNRFGESQTDFALMLFAGLIVFNVFAECIGRTPALIRNNLNYVTRVVFPLEILPVTIVLSSIFHLLLSFIPLVIVTTIIKGHVVWTTFYWPLLLLPLLAGALGMSWFLSTLGVFARDLSEAVLALTTILMYASAVFYPISLVTEKAPAVFHPLVQWNPVAQLVEQSRLTAIAGQPLDWTIYLWLVVGGFVALLGGYSVFMRAKQVFADVL